MVCLKARKYINFIKQYNSFLNIKEFVNKLKYDTNNNILFDEYIYYFEYEAPLYLNEYLLKEFPSIKYKLYSKEEYIKILSEYDDILIKNLPDKQFFMVIDIYDFEKFIVIENINNKLLKENYIDLKKILTDYQYYKYIFEKLKKIVIRKKLDQNFVKKIDSCLFD